jgi:phenylpropionate dioxygenase-like ring-hydroxylating dioxygenase large terminal subunit
LNSLPELRYALSSIAHRLGGPLSDRFPLPPFPRGWYRVADGGDLEREQVAPLRAFGLDLVLTRGAGGAAALFDAHCPHLGTHLGHGGRMVGDLLECPFHGWRFDRDGGCTSIPLADAIPSQARLRAWHLHEINGVILAWYDPAGGAPDWEMPELPERASPEWTSFHPAKRWIIRTHAQEIVENGIDCAHFPHNHRRQTAGVESLGLEIDGPRITHHMIQHHNIFGIGTRLGWQVTGTLDVTAHALSCVVNRARIRDGISLDYCVVFYILPVDPERVAVHSYYAMRRRGLLTLPLIWMAMRDGSYTIDQDVPIWEHKLYRTRPCLSKADGPIMQFRKWARQFYAEGDAATVGAAPSGSEPAISQPSGHSSGTGTIVTEAAPAASSA